jgi:hypothetical protein
MTHGRSDALSWPNVQSKKPRDQSWRTLQRFGGGCLGATRLIAHAPNCGGAPGDLPRNAANNEAQTSSSVPAVRGACDRDDAGAGQQFPDAAPPLLLEFELLPPGTAFAVGPVLRLDPAVLPVPVVAVPPFGAAPDVQAVRLVVPALLPVAGLLPVALPGACAVPPRVAGDVCVPAEPGALPLVVPAAPLVPVEAAPDEPDEPDAPAELCANAGVSDSKIAADHAQR